ncbi:type IV secretion system DNA-binding domain-containing protein [Yinghuangia sp. ASG 101]|uniref:type IV secretion system DNA-binding domain-containing protein n=1 Tax=Yinghuangia sp. ASG 101 TaxID=2896848 RepID=UPI001E38EE65|nr:type IV secretion system DNA-binding domain-containing protein [Yinghuangia sp. ASG 101]UGQ10540.1 type IV secretion system DNA-binding domain-containing protein [Yinghuangia sp. ASG 101]
MIQLLVSRPVFTASEAPLRSFIRDPAGAVDAFAHWALAWGPVIGPLAVALGLLAFWAHRWWRNRCHARLVADARVITVLAPPTASSDGGAALWANLVGLLHPPWKRRVFGQPHLVWEYLFTRDSIRIQIWVPGTVPQHMVEHAVQAAWPGAQTDTRPATAPWAAPSGGHIETLGGEVRLARSEALPIRTQYPDDPLRALLGAPTDLGRTEQTVVQILARPVTGWRVTKARRSARLTRSGSRTNPAGVLLDVITPRTSRASAAKRRAPAGKADRQTSLEESAQDRVIVAKLRGALYETRVRYAVTTQISEPTMQDTELQAKIRNRLRGRAHAVAAAFAAYTDHNYYRRTRLRHPYAALAERRFARGDLLSVPELSVLAHVPWDESVPGLQRAGARAVPPPPGILATGADIRPVGTTDSGHPRPIGLRVADARHHVHIIGATGSGKSELMARMILHDAEAGRGVVVVDPKGDLVTDVMMRLPERLGRRVVLFDADSRATPPILNPLEGDDAARAVDNLVGIFSRIYAASWGPRTDDILRAGLLTLRAMSGPPLLSGPATLADLPKLLAVPSFRAQALDQIHDDVLAGFWTWYDALSDPARAQMTAPLMNKVRGFLLRPFVRAAIAGGASTVDMNAVLDHAGICLVRIARDALGTETSRLVGSIVVARTWQAATRRARTPQSQRRDASLYIDEAHNFLNLPYPLEDMLAEARGYRLSMTLAHQYLGQLPSDLAEGISANARTKIFFNASPEDARQLARHTAPRLTEHDLSNLGAFQVAIRPVLHGAEAPAFTGTTDKLPEPIPGRAKQIRLAARANAQPRRANPAKPRRPGADPRRSA